MQEFRSRQTVARAATVLTFSGEHLNKIIYPVAIISRPEELVALIGPLDKVERRFFRGESE